MPQKQKDTKKLLKSVCRSRLFDHEKTP